MKKMATALCISSLAVGNLFVSAAAETLTLEAVADAQLLDSSPGTNYGDIAKLSTRNSSGETRYTYIQFDISKLAGKVVDEATLYITPSDEDLPGAMDIYSVTSAWDEGAVTWDTKPSHGVYAATLTVPSDSVGVAVGSDDPITGLVSSWADGSLANNGLVLVPDGTMWNRYWSRDNANSAIRPFISVEVHDDPSIQAPSGSAGIGRDMITAYMEAKGLFTPHVDNCEISTETFIEIGDGLGFCMESTARGGGNWYTARQSCVAVGKRLPEPGEYLLAATVSAIGFGEELASNYYLNDGNVPYIAAPIFGVGNNPYMTWQRILAVNSSDSSPSYTYRCVH